MRTGGLSRINPISSLGVRSPPARPSRAGSTVRRCFLQFLRTIQLGARCSAGVQLYATLLLEGLSRTILAGSHTTQQDVRVVLHIYFQAVLRWWLREHVISDHGGQFTGHGF